MKVEISRRAQRSVERIDRHWRERADDRELFRDEMDALIELREMADPNPEGLELTPQAELEDELRQAEQDFARGDFIELTVEDLDRSIAAGEWPWPTESSA